MRILENYMINNKKKGFNYTLLGFGDRQQRYGINYHAFQ